MVIQWSFSVMSAAKLWGNSMVAMIGCTEKLQENIIRTNRKVQHEHHQMSPKHSNTTIPYFGGWTSICQFDVHQSCFWQMVICFWGSWKESPDSRVPWSMHWRWMQSWHSQIHCEMPKNHCFCWGMLLIFETLDGIPSISFQVSHHLEGFTN